MQLLDTPQWEGLTEDEKRIVGNVYGNDTGEGWQTLVSPAAQQVVEGLVVKGLIIALWGDQRTARLRAVTLRIREAGWSQ